MNPKYLELPNGQLVAKCDVNGLAMHPTRPTEWLNKTYPPCVIVNYGRGCAHTICTECKTDMEAEALIQRLRRDLLSGDRIEPAIHSLAAYNETVDELKRLAKLDDEDYDRYYGIRPALERFIESLGFGEIANMSRELGNEK